MTLKEIREWFCSIETHVSFEDTIRLKQLFDLTDNTKGRITELEDCLVPLLNWYWSEVDPCEEVEIFEKARQVLEVKK